MIASVSAGGCESLGAIFETEPTITAATSFDPQPYTRTAIITQSEVRSSAGLERDIDTIFTQELLAKGYQVVSRTDLDEALDELEFQGSALTESQVAEVGSFLGVPGVIIATITSLETFSSRSDRGTSYRTKATVTTRLLDVESADIMWSGRNEGSVSGRNNNAAAIADAAEQLAEDIPTLMPWIKIDSDPGRADVMLNGTFVGQTPVTLQLESLDAVELSISRSGYGSWTQSVTPFDGLRLKPSLERIK
ncbi:MAG: CsgG/HfaB family protein [Planctomycetota bacterium]